MMHSDPSNLRQRFILLEEGGTIDDVPAPRPRRVRSRRRRLAIAAAVVVSVAYVKIILFRMLVEAFASTMLQVHGGACTTASEAALALGVPERIANMLPVVVVLSDAQLWYPTEAARSGAQHSIEHSKLCGGEERRVLRASLFTVDSSGLIPVFSRRLRKTFKGVEAACVQRSIEAIANGTVCGI